MVTQPQPEHLFTMSPLTEADIQVLDKNYGDISNAIPQGLLAAFRANGITLDADMSLMILAKGGQWLMSDGNNYFEMRKTDAGGLDIYRLTAAMFAVLKTKAATANGVAALSIITAACHAIQNTQLNPLDDWKKDPKKKPGWFDPLVKHLDTAQNLAAEWINDIGPVLTAKLPSKIVTYGSTYASITDEIIEIANAHPQARGKDDPNVKNVFALISALKGSVTDIHTEIIKEADLLKDWGRRMQAAFNDLSGGIGDIQKAEIDLQADINSMNAAIDGLHAQISGEVKAIAGAGIAIGVGLLVLVVGIGLAPVTGGASLVVSGIAAAGVVGGIVTWAVMQHKIDEQYKQIAEDQKRIADDARQMVALKGLETGTTQATNATNTATTVLSNVRALWLLLANELDGVLEQLNKADMDLALIVDKAFVNGAQKEWDIATELANALINTPLKIEEHKNAPMVSQAA